MSVCPFCGHPNIPGADACDKCGHSLTPLSKPRASSSLEWKIRKMTIRELAVRPPVTVSPNTPVGEVLKRMVDKATGCAIVEESGQPVGIFTDRDVILRLGVNVEKLKSQPISDFMTRNPATLDIDDRIVFAIHKMDAGGFRHIPIRSNGRIMGVISVREILRFLTHDGQAA